MMDRHPYRPAHVHVRLSLDSTPSSILTLTVQQFYVTAPGHKTLVTQVFDRESKYLEDDSVFAVKESLIVDFAPVSAPLPTGSDLDEKPKFQLEYNIALASDQIVSESKFQG